jgi:hypothetical protein
LQTLPIFCRWPFALAIIAASTAAGVACFRVLDHLDPVGELEYWFYAKIYTGIGTITGLAAWYFARLVAAGSTSPRRITLALALPYAFILLLALDKNLFVAAIATAAFGLILLLSWLATVFGRAQHNRSAG